MYIVFDATIIKTHTHKVELEFTFVNNVCYLGLETINSRIYLNDGMLELFLQFVNIRKYLLKKKNTSVWLTILFLTNDNF